MTPLEASLVLIAVAVGYLVYQYLKRGFLTPGATLTWMSLMTFAVLVASFG